MRAVVAMTSTTRTPPCSCPARVITEEGFMLTRSPNVPLFLRHLQHRGFATAALKERFSLPPSAEGMPDIALQHDRAQALGEACASLAADHTFGLATAAWAPRGACGLVDLACWVAPTLGEALRRLVEYHPLVSHGTDCLELEETRTRLEISFSLPGVPECWGRHLNECLVGLLCTRLKQATGGRLALERVWLAHADSVSLSRLREVFEAPQVTVGTGRCGVAIPRAALALPLVSADEAVLVVLDTEAKRRLHSAPLGTHFVSRVRQRVRDQLDTGPSLSRTARELAISPRTLQRQLAAHDTTFRDVVDQVRMEWAGELLRTSSLPCSRIAKRLGYSEARAFARAFKRRMGRSPLQVRQQMRRPGAA